MHTTWFDRQARGRCLRRGTSSMFFTLRISETTGWSRR